VIAKLAGVIDQVGADAVVIDVNGVGYLAFCSTSTISRLPPPGLPARLLIETHVREDHIHLYGFVDEAEREWFRLLTTVQGVGARIALAILSALSPEALATAIAAQDKAAITEADGVGPKLGQRIVSELKDKVGGIALGPAAPAPLAAASEAVSALVNLGYPRSDAHAVIAAVSRRLGGEASLDALIRAGLKDLGMKEAVALAPIGSSSRFRALSNRATYEWAEGDSEAWERAQVAAVEEAERAGDRPNLRWLEWFALTQAACFGRWDEVLRRVEEQIALGPHYTLDSILYIKAYILAARDRLSQPG